MTIYLASDHAGFEHKEKLKLFLQQKDVEVIDCGAYQYDAEDDYPDFVIKAAQAVNCSPKTARAIIFGGSGQGEAMLANRFAHVRAAVFYGGDPAILTLSREHNDANVLSLGARFIPVGAVPGIVDTWLSVAASKQKKYQRRTKKISFGQ